jgi:DNA-binding IclR family transcriptional regulator
MTKIEGAGGKLEGSVEEIGARLGLSKSSAHRALHAPAGAGMISLATSGAGTLVEVR